MAVAAALAAVAGARAFICSPRKVATAETARRIARAYACTRGLSVCTCTLHTHRPAIVFLMPVVNCRARLLETALARPHLPPRRSFFRAPAPLPPFLFRDFRNRGRGAPVRSFYSVLLLLARAPLNRKLARCWEGCCGKHMGDKHARARE